MKKNIYLIAAALLVLVGCQNNHNPPPARQSVEFSASIGTYATRAADDHWDAGDQVGIYMMAAGQPLDATALALNKLYTTTGTGTLVPASAADEIFYPDNGAPVDFIAYYPWRATITDFTYPVNIALQTPMSEIDLLWSDNAKGVTKRDPVAGMTFTHRLSKLVLNITRETWQIATPAVTIEDVATTADFSLASGLLSNAGSVADIPMTIHSTGEKSDRAEAIVIPGAGIDYSLLFKIGEKTMRVTLSDVTWEPGKKYIHNVNITDEALFDDDAIIIDWDEEPGGELEIDVKDEPKGPATGLLYFDADGTLSIGLWGAEITSANYREQLAFFQFGSVVGFIIDPRNGTEFNPARDIVFDPTGGDYANYLAMPRFTTDDYADEIRNISGADYHNGAAVLAGRGDPCGLVGFKGSDFAGKSAAEVDQMLANAVWRLPTGPENAAFVDGNADRWPEAENNDVPSVMAGEGNLVVTTTDNPMTVRFLAGEYPDVILPAVGYRSLDGAYRSIDMGSGFTWLWSSTPNTLDEYSAYDIGFTPTMAWAGNYFDYEGGFIIRCVRR